MDITAEELERIVTIIQNPTQYKIPGCTITPEPPDLREKEKRQPENMFGLTLVAF